MATLPRLRPRRFYDLVVQVAIIRPGPIVGQMVHPFLARRAGRAAGHVSRIPPRADPRAHPRRAALPGAAPPHGDGRRRLHGRRGRGAPPRPRLPPLARRACRRSRRSSAPGIARGITGRARGDRRAITAFALYGFPECHAASFALLAYASAYLKVHHPAEFYAALLNNQPMGFYHPATVVRDAIRRGQAMRPVDVGVSAWRATVEDRRGAARARAGQGAPRGGRPPGSWPRGRSALRVRGRPLAPGRGSRGRR